jgi:hypothetical protein
MRVTLKTERLFAEIPNMDHNLQDVLKDVFVAWPCHSITLTCIHRTREEDIAVNGNGVHNTFPHRAVDVGIRNLGANRVEFWRRARSVATAINRKWSYDFHRPNLKVAVCIPHGTGPHLHLQVHRFTRRKVNVT